MSLSVKNKYNITSHIDSIYRTELEKGSKQTQAFSKAIDAAKNSLSKRFTSSQTKSLNNNL